MENKKLLITVFVRNTRNVVTFVQFGSLLDKRVVVLPFSQVVWLFRFREKDGCKTCAG